MDAICTAMCAGSAPPAAVKEEKCRCDWTTVIIATILLCLGAAGAGLGFIRSQTWLAFGGTAIAIAGAAMITAALW
jgi:hypothetical protein